MNSNLRAEVAVQGKIGAASSRAGPDATTPSGGATASTNRRSDSMRAVDEHLQHASVLIEDDPDYVSPFGKDTAGHALYSALVTLTLGVLGSTVLPVPYAFSKTGIAAGAVTMALVAAANDATCCMLIRAAAHTGLTTFEQLSEWAGGPKARVFTQMSLILLLYGTLCGGLAFLSDVARVMVDKGLGADAAPLLAADGRPIMVLTVLTVLLPLCLQRHIRQFEKAATVGVVVVVVLCALIVTRAVREGFPAVRDGELDVFSVKLDGHLSEAFAVLGFAFYMQPMMMPLLKEMPAGPTGARLTERAVHITLFVVACGVYGTVGIFGAAIFGSATESNIMVNTLLPGCRTATLILYASLLVYLCCGMVTTHYALRASLDLLLVGPDAPFTWSRQVAETLGILTCATCVALLFPTEAEKIFALTGCTAVCLVCYVIPVYIHLAVQRDVRRLAAAEEEAERQHPSGGGSGHVGEERTAAPAGVAAAAAAAASETHKDALREPLLESSSSDAAAAAAGTTSACGRGKSHGMGNGSSSSSSSNRNNETKRVSNAAGVCRVRRGENRGVVPTAICAVQQYAVPVAIVAIGVGFSLAGLYVGFMDLMSYLYGPGDGGDQTDSPPALSIRVPLVR